MRVTTQLARRVVVALVGLALLSAACESGDDGAETAQTTAAPTTTTTVASTTTTTVASTTTTTAAREAIALTLTFHGDSCTYEGPTELTPGPVELTYLNESEEIAALNLTEHMQDKTIQDVIDYIGEEPTTKHAPPWVRDLGTWRGVGAGMNHSWKWDIEPATYHMVCARMTPLAVWFGTGLTVEG